MFDPRDQWMPLKIAMGVGLMLYGFPFMLALAHVLGAL
jgi:hypothetical protein